ncbi:MAG: hypothetical protein ABWY05_07015 [Noviherbaspirillum sp.]
MRTRHLSLTLALSCLLALPASGTRAVTGGTGALSLASDGAVCRSPRTGRPPMLGALMLAQARTETRPFRPEPAPLSRDETAGKAYGLWPDLGTLSMPVSTQSRQAQQYFNQGLRLGFAFNHGEAARAFRAAQQRDPECAMCYWGEALVLGPNINAPMFPQAVKPARDAADRALALSHKARPHEQALIAALDKRYSADPKAERAPLDGAYAEAMAAAAQRFPGDDNIQALYAESLMDLQPWDYWEAGGTRPKGRAGDLVPTLERVLQRNPRHPGAIHLYIHAVEASADPKRALPHARRLAALMPGAGHIVHMPSHIYYRVGLYREALQTNARAVAVDERHFARTEAEPFYRNAYYPHNLHFLMVSAQMGGDGKAALDAAAKLDQVIAKEVLREAAALQPIKAAPYFTHAQFSEPDTILALPDPGAEFLLVQAMWRYARAVAFAARKDTAGAAKEIAALNELEVRGDFTALEAWQVPGKAILQTARHVADARLSAALGDYAAAARSYEQAVAIQDSLAYMEPPYWYYPIHQSLGAVLLQAGRVDEAERAFRASLARVPNNGWALYGLQQVYRQRGDARSARAADRALQDAWFGDRSNLNLARL